VINKRVRMSDPYKIGVQLFLLILSRGIMSVHIHRFFVIAFKLFTRARCLYPLLLPENCFFLRNTAISCAYDGPREPGLFSSLQRTDFSVFPMG
jgi:hypothetical protein